MEALINLFGEGSFDASVSDPWITLLTRENSSLQRGLRHAWNQLQVSNQAIGVPIVENSLLCRNVNGAGRLLSGATPKSVTHAITFELEKGRFEKLNNLVASTLTPNSSQESRAWRNVDRYSSQFLNSPPDAIGFLSDSIFPEVFTQYLGLPSPAVRPFIGQYIGTPSQVYQVDDYGNHLAVHSHLPGYGHTGFHMRMQTLIGEMAKAAGLEPVLEALNIFHGKVSGDSLRAYYQAYSETARVHDLRHCNKKDAIIPDVLIHNYPLSLPELHSQGRSARSGAAIFEIKGIRICNQRYPAMSRDSDKRADSVRTEYVKKAQTCDRRFAASTPSDVGPFQRAISSFATGGVIPLVFGAFGESNKEVDAAVTMFAIHAAATETGLCLSPHNSSNHRSGAYPILLHQFRRALALAAVRGHAELKLKRLHFIRSTESGAKVAGKAPMKHSPFSSSSTSSFPKWFQRSTDDNYDAFRQFTKGRYNS
jgi:hypothetical protein